MPRTTSPRARRVAPRSAAVAPADEASSRDSEPFDRAWQRSLDLSRALFGASLGTSQEWARGLGDWQQAQAAAWRHAGECIDDVASQAERAGDWPSLWALQARLAGTQWTRAVQEFGELFDQALQIEARLVERSRADAARLSKHWQIDARAESPAGAQEAAQAVIPLALFDQAQQSMSEMSRLWTQALYRTAMPD